ncbi:hypothetical protein [Pseudomonas fragi]|uniref:hypothetical protein n=1 Tax=Pseudomonas fragi TaxID=296 RepID=UPI001C52DB59
MPVDLVEHGTQRSLITQRFRQGVALLGQPFVRLSQSHIRLHGAIGKLKGTRDDQGST